jgi:hypothetical protein
MYILLLALVSSGSGRRVCGTAHPAAQSSVPLARPRYCELASSAAWGGLRPYIEQRLDSRGVLGRLQLVSENPFKVRACILTILSSAGIGWRCVLSTARGSEGASWAADLAVSGPSFISQMFRQTLRIALHFHESSPPCRAHHKSPSHQHWQVQLALSYSFITRNAPRKLCATHISSIDPSNCSQAMHAGVIRDYEQQRVKRERQADFEMQRALEEEYRKVQNVSDGGGPAAQGSGTGT